MTTSEKLAEAKREAAGARSAWVAAKTNAAKRRAFNELEFWSNKAAMLEVMVNRGM